MAKRPLEREGQAMVNTLFEYDCDAYDDLCEFSSQHTDCFSEDTMIPNLIKALEERWNVEPS